MNKKTNLVTLVTLNQRYHEQWAWFFCLFSVVKLKYNSKWKSTLISVHVVDLTVLREQLFEEHDPVQSYSMPTSFYILVLFVSLAKSTLIKILKWKKKKKICIWHEVWDYYATWYLDNKMLMFQVNFHSLFTDLTAWYC